VTACPHLDLDAAVDIARLIEPGAPPATAVPVGFAAEIRAWCRACSVQFRVVDPSLPVGLLPGRVTVDVACTALRAPLWPADGTEPPRDQRLAEFTITDLSRPKD
jgi:hypothetical protein